MSYSFDKDEIKNSLSISQVESLVSELGGEPREIEGGFVAKTICHCGEQHKLFYYDNTKLFRCYTECQDTFDIISLVQKIKSREIENYSFTDALRYVAQFFGIAAASGGGEGFSFKLKDWNIFDKYTAMKEESSKDKKVIELKTYNKDILRYLPTPIIQPWVDEGISLAAMKAANIKYDPVTCSVIIPHYDMNGKLIGIRQRTLIKENEKYGKYLPATLNGQIYNHPLSFSLYHLNISKENIRRAKKAIIFEAEKSTLLYYTYFGKDNDISVACCGSNLIQYQFNLLKDLGVEEIIIAFDKQFQKVGDKEYHQWVNKLTEIHKKYGQDVLVSFVFDKTGDHLSYKASPIDEGIDKFIELFKERVYL